MMGGGDTEGRVPGREAGRRGMAVAGTGRVMGPATVCRLFQVLVPDDSDAQSGADHVHLGVRLRRYRLTHDSSALDNFLQACRTHPLRWPTEGSLSAIAASARQAVVAIGRQAAALQTKVDGYVADYIVRKLVLRRLVAEACERRYIDWSATSLEQLRLVSPDASDFLGALPPTWAAAEASWFFFDRPDWGCLISMFACLWKEAADTWDGDAALAACASGDFPLAVRSLTQAHGVVPRPAAALRMCLG